MKGSRLHDQLLRAQILQARSYPTRDCQLATRSRKSGGFFGGITQTSTWLCLGAVKGDGPLGLHSAGVSDRVDDGLNHRSRTDGRSWHKETLLAPRWTAARDQYRPRLLQSLEVRRRAALNVVFEKHPDSLAGP